jgi:hypothetical protein
MGDWVYGAVSGVDFPSGGRQRMVKQKARLTSNDSGPDDGIASPMLFGGYPLLHSLNLNRVARSAARGVSCRE